MNNIYDIFNNRKSHINDTSFDLDNTLENIIKESTNEMIELQSAMYLEDLVLENMMYDDFDEYEMESIIEATMKERVNKAVEFIKKQWRRLKEWFINVMRSIENFFASGEKFVHMHDDIIPDAMKKCKAKVVMNQYNDIEYTFDKYDKFIDEMQGVLSTSSDGQNKDDIINKLKIKNVDDISKIVRTHFIKTEKPVETEISSIDPDIAMGYNLQKKYVLNIVKKGKRDIDSVYREVIKELENGNEDEKIVQNKIADVQFVMRLLTKYLNAMINYTKKGAHEHTLVMKKAISMYKKEN